MKKKKKQLNLMSIAQEELEEEVDPFYAAIDENSTQKNIGNFCC